MNIISQDYFDETCRENADVFDLTEEQAAQETVTQLTASSMANVTINATGTGASDSASDSASNNDASNSNSVLQHLLLSHPDSASGQRQRRERAAFVAALECVRTHTSESEASDSPTSSESDSRQQELHAALQLVDDKINSNVVGSVLVHGLNETRETTITTTAVVAADDVNTTTTTTTYPLDAVYYRHVFHTEQGWTIYMTALQSLVTAHQLTSDSDSDSDNSMSLVRVLIQTLTRLVTAVPNGKSNHTKLHMWHHRRSLQQIMPTNMNMVTWLKLYQVTLVDVMKQHDHDHDHVSQAPAAVRLQLLQNLLVLGHCAIQQCERNKQSWTRLQLPDVVNDDQEQQGAGDDNGNGGDNGGHVSKNMRSLLELLLDTVDGVHEHLAAASAAAENGGNDNDEWYTVARTVGRFLTSLGTFEESAAMPAPATDINANDNGTEQGTPVVASAHATVLAMSELGAVHKLLALCRDCPNEPAVVTTLRCMAIHDSIVQTMVAGGILEIVRACFVNTNNDNDTDGDNGDGDQDTKETDAVETTAAAVKQWALCTAVIGLVRNLCANDEIKSTLCGGRQSVVQELIQIMNSTFRDKTGISHALLLEHACGTIAAMALRISRNAKYLVALGAADEIVRAMNKYPDKVALQRQAALAIRNIVSRSTDLCPAVLQAGAQAALTTIAARHQGCQDEVYAALRDLGVPVTMRVAEQDDVTGKMVLRQREMFGERTPHFRAVFEKS